MERKNDEIVDELRKINKILTLLALESKTQKEQLIFLNQLGHSYAEIGEVTNMKPDAVRMSIQRVKKGS